jgi:molybdate-binding protein/DNA-binding transcriptional regulator YhcF (GntR family)
MPRDSEALLYAEIAESIRRRILAGELQPGDQLPPIREQAERWKCTPGTISRAYATLAEEGLVIAHRGAGTRVTRGALQVEPEPWRWAALVNMAERYVLDALHSGYDASEAEAALSLAVARLRDLRSTATLHSPRARPEKHLRFVGSHDLVVDLLPRMLSSHEPLVTLDTDYVGSLGGLFALAREEADLAGVHLWDAATNTYNVPFVQRVLPGKEMVLLTLFHRSLGLMLSPGNPQQVLCVADLARPGVRLANRQEGSGTRVWLDAQLKILDVEAEAIEGYQTAELTHLAAARAVAEGRATVALGIQAAAAAFGLEFVPLTAEQYDLAVPAETWDSRAIVALLTLVRSDEFHRAVQALGGYDLRATGRELRVT